MENIAYTKTVIDSFKLRYSEIADPITETNDYKFSSADNSTYS